MVGWLCSYPLDVVKSLVQSETGDRRKGVFSATSLRWLMMSCSSFNMCASGGARMALQAFSAACVPSPLACSFLAGIRPTLLRAFIVSGVRFSIYEAVVLALTPAATTLHDR
jgi:hypothetical protein